MKKRILALGLSIMLLVAFGACSRKEANFSSTLQNNLAMPQVTSTTTSSEGTEEFSLVGDWSGGQAVPGSEGVERLKMSFDSQGKIILTAGGDELEANYSYDPSTALIALTPSIDHVETMYIDVQKKDYFHLYIKKADAATEQQTIQSPNGTAFFTDVCYKMIRDGATENIPMFPENNNPRAEDFSLLGSWDGTLTRLVSTSDAGKRMSMTFSSGGAFSMDGKSGNYEYDPASSILTFMSTSEHPGQQAYIKIESNDSFLLYFAQAPSIEYYRDYLEKEVLERAVSGISAEEIEEQAKRLFEADRVDIIERGAMAAPNGMRFYTDDYYAMTRSS